MRRCNSGSCPIQRRLGFLSYDSAGEGLIHNGHFVGDSLATFFESGVAIATLTFAARPLFTVLFETMKARRRASLLELGAGFAIVVAVQCFLASRWPFGSWPAERSLLGHL